jgi:hypothetical protein
MAFVVLNFDDRQSNLSVVFLIGDCKMKNGKMKTFALLGLSAGVLMAQAGLEAQEVHQPINLDYVLAKPGCKAHGCGGLTADRDMENTKKYPKKDANDKSKENSNSDTDDKEDKDV